MMQKSTDGSAPSLWPRSAFATGCLILMSFAFIKSRENLIEVTMFVLASLNVGDVGLK